MGIKSILDMDKIIEFIKSYKVILIISILLVSAFYWYEWRPTQIKKECSRISQLGKSGSGLYQLDGFGITPDERYKNCLRSKGL